MDIATLIHRSESEILDFKLLHHADTLSLLHDILCLANSWSESDRFLVFGVSDNGTISGVERDPNRRTGANIQDLLRGSRLNRLPTVSMETHQVGGHDIDVLTIKNRPDKPFFVTADREYQGRTIRAGVVYTRIPVFKSEPKRRRRHNVLFRLSDIYRIRQKVFTSWLAEAKQLAAMRALYALAVHGNHFVEGRFLALCQGIEGFHFRYRKGVFMPQDAFNVQVAQALIAAIPNNIDPLLQASLEDRIKYGYQFSLNKRLKLLFAEFKDALDAVVPDATKTIRPIVEQRNYLVHDPLVGGFQGRPGREEYQKFNFVLKMVTELCLLSVMKIPKKKITQLFAKSYLHKATAQHLFKT